MLYNSRHAYRLKPLVYVTLFGLWILVSQLRSITPIVGEVSFMSKNNNEKYYSLYLINNNKYESLLAISDDRWLVELFVIQRNLRKKKIIVKKERAKDLPPFSDKFLIYYFGYAVTDFEYNYIVNNALEYETEIVKAIYNLENGLIMYRRFLKPNRIKAIKKAIKYLKEEQKGFKKNKKFAKDMIDTVIDRGGLVIDYMENLEKFRQCMGE